MDRFSLNIDLSEKERELKERFIQWLIENGCEFSEIRYPSVFTNEKGEKIAGISAKRDFKQGERLFRVNNRVFVGSDNIQKGELKEIIRECKGIVKDDDYYTILIFLLAEKHKESVSFYQPLLESLEDYSIH